MTAVRTGDDDNDEDLEVPTMNTLRIPIAVLAILAVVSGAAQARSSHYDELAICRSPTPIRRRNRPTRCTTSWRFSALCRPISGPPPAMNIYAMREDLHHLIETFLHQVEKALHGIANPKFAGEGKPLPAVARAGTVAA